MKILHVVTLSELGGAQSVLINLARESIENGHEVMVASSLGGELWKELPDKVQKRPINALQRAISLTKDFLVVKDLKIINQEFKPDVVHLHSSKIGFLGRLSFPRKRIIYTVHGFDSIRIAFRKFLFIEKIMQNWAQHVVAVSKYDYENLVAEGIHKNVNYIYNGISDFSQSVNLNDDDAAFQMTKSSMLKSKTFNVLCIARLTAQKKFDLFCETATLLKEHNIHFFWVGNKEQKTDIPENVHLMGEVANAHRLLPYCQIFMLPSNYEGLPISILEALSYGIPVIASDVGGIGEILNNKNGFAVKNDSSLFAEHILNYKNNLSFYEQAKMDARESYQSNYTVSKMFQSYLKLYNSILSNMSSV